ncbi:aminopeptidase [Rhodocytophaga aerolata]
MKTNVSLSTLLLCSSLSLLAQVQPVNSTSQENLVNRIVTSVANIKPGETVLIEGDKQQIDLMEALAEQVHKKGAYPMLLLETEKVAKAGALLVPEAHLAAHHKALHKLDGKADLAIILSSNIDYNAIDSQVPKAYADKRQKARQQVHNGQEEDLRTAKTVYIGLPTKAVAEANGLAYGTYEQMTNAALAVDYETIAAKGKKIAAMLKTGKKVQITTANGSDFTFDLASRSVIINDGVISEEDIKSSVKLDRYVTLPSGFIVVSGVETSANGKVFVARDRLYGNTGEEKITNLSFDFVDGKMTNLKAATNQAFLEKILTDADPRMNQFAGFAIGLNPALKVLSDEKQDYRPIEAEGLVSLLLGGNDLWGGTNKVKEGIGFAIEKANVSIDGKVIVKDGKLMPDKLTTSN